ncbi:MAG: hypothetical protein KC910_14030 [Candidatus Eremiobacteraeota bacterium]|nr:hypothetical protein [Candidatus Eremiobacteraeota bacterium]
MGRSLNLTGALPLTAVERPQRNVVELLEKSLVRLPGMSAEQLAGLRAYSAQASQDSGRLRDMDGIKKPDFDDVWTLHRDAETEGPTCRSVSELQRRLSLDWNRNPGMKALVDVLTREGLATPENLSHLERIYRSHGADVAEKVAQTLADYAGHYRDGLGDEQKQLIADALHDLAVPSDINQRNVGSCAATAAQMKLAIEKPTEYVRILTDLAKGENTKLLNGDTLRPNTTWRGDKDDRRSLSCKIMQNAFMEYAGGSYNSKTDKDEGLSRGEQEDLLEGLFGDSDYNNETTGLFTDKDDLYSYVEDDLARGRAVVVSFPHHAVTVVGIDKRSTPHKVIIDSWGAQYSMSVEEFKKYLQAVRDLDDSGWDDRKTPDGQLTIVGDH